MLRRIAWFLFAIPAGIVLIVAMFANKHAVPVNLDPFRDLKSSAIAFDIPLYALLMSSLVIGVVLGGIATWFGQGRWRKTARQRGQEALRWEAEAGRLTRERDAAAPSHHPPTGRAVARIGSR